MRSASARGATPQPSALTAPRPVTATSRIRPAVRAPGSRSGIGRVGRRGGAAGSPRTRRDGRPSQRRCGRSLALDADAEFLLERHHELERIDRIEAEAGAEQGLVVGDALRRRSRRDSGSHDEPLDGRAGSVRCPDMEAPFMTSRPAATARAVRGAMGRQRCSATRAKNSPSRSRVPGMRAPVPGEDGKDGLIDAEAASAREPEVAEVGVVEADSEAAEMMIAPADLALIGARTGTHQGRSSARPPSRTSAASSPACIARRTPVEKIGSRKAAASPTATHRSPAEARAEIGVVGVEAGGRDAPRFLHQGGRGGGGCEVVSQGILGSRLALSGVHALRDDSAHTHDRVRDRDEPDPPHIGPGEHSYVPGPAALARGIPS